MEDVSGVILLRLAVSPILSKQQIAGLCLPAPIYVIIKIPRYHGEEVFTVIQISVSELKLNPGKYVSMVNNEDVYITKNGKLVAKLTTAKPDKVAAAKALFGLLPSDVDLDKAREERLS